MREHLSTTCRMLIESYLVNQAGFVGTENKIINNNNLKSEEIGIYSDQTTVLN